MRFDYYYGQEADEFSFIRIPKVMVLGEEFSDLSIMAKLLYGLLLDRMGLSMKNRWLDDKNRVYIIYQISDIQNDLGVSERKAINLLKELETYGLVEKRRRGLGLPSLLFVKSFINKEVRTAKRSNSKTDNIGLENTEIILKTDENDNKVEDYISNSGKSGKKIKTNSCSRIAEIADSRTDILDGYGTDENSVLEHSEKAPLYSNTKYIKNNVINSNHIISIDRKGVEKTIKKNIEYEILIHDHKDSKELVQGILELMIEIALSSNDNILIASNWYPAELVKERFMKLTFSHVTYVIDSIQANTTKVLNVKKYLLAALFNASATIDASYTMKVNHDYPQYVSK